jgi:PD-(D/E)XK nuclease superfamily
MLRAMDRGAGVVEVHPGARATEAALLAAVGPLIQVPRGALAEPARLSARLAAPVRIVVPSRTLREHVAARLVRGQGGAALGVVVQTLRGLAHEVLDRAGQEARPCDALLPILVPREARQEPTLYAALEGVRDGYASALGSVADLLDAGFEPENLAGLLEALEESSAPEPARARAGALARVAARTQRALAGLGLLHRSELLARAAEILGDRPESLPARGLFVHGFADVTGTAGAVLEALVRAHGARVLLDQPPDPADPKGAAAPAFVTPLRERLEAWSGPACEAAEAPDPPKLVLLEAAGLEAEVRGVAERVRWLLDEGAMPERIGIVARALEPFAVAIRRHLRRLAIPFSGASGTAPIPLPGARVLRALLQLLREGGATPADVWLAASAGGRRAARQAEDRALAIDLRVAFHALGAARLADVAALDVAERLGGERSLALPVREGLRLEGAPREEEAAGADEGESDAEGASPRATRRRVAAALLEARVADARALAGALEGFAGRASVALWRERLEGLLVDALHWHRGGSFLRPVLGVLESLASEVPEDLELEAGEVVVLLERGLRAEAREPLGGSGAGVAVLTVTEARGLVFDHLFVIGLNRDAFPRRVTEDPLLPDPLRAALEPVLPHMPRKGRGLEEEPFLFAQLCAAGEHVWLSWHTVSEEGRARTPSPLVERLRLAGRSAEALPALFAPGPAGPRLRPAFEHAIAAGLRAGEGAREATFAAAAEEARNELGAPLPVAAPALAAARAAVRLEADADPASRGLGPYFGFVGPVQPADLRNAKLFVTHLEGLARCPWQHFLRKLLALEPVPDALGWLPGPDPRLQGSAVHAALEAVIRAGLAAPGADELEEALAREAPVFHWPAPGETERLVREAVEATLRAEGIALPGYGAALARPVATAVARARELLGPAPRIVASEVWGAANLALGEDAPRVIHFKADLVERDESGRAVLSDFKTGRDAISTASGEETRAQHLREGIRRGQRLQAMIYAHAAPGAKGRYLFLHEGIPEDARVVEVEPAVPELAQAFDDALRELLAARAAGVFPPRLLGRSTAREAKACAFCEVRDACLQGDSGARERLRRWIDRQSALDRDARALEAPLRALWSLGPRE